MAALLFWGLCRDLVRYINFNFCNYTVNEVVFFFSFQLICNTLSFQFKNLASMYVDAVPFKFILPSYLDHFARHIFLNYDFDYCF